MGKRITVNITDEQYDFLTRAMDENNQTQSQVVQECIQGSLDVDKWIKTCEAKVKRFKEKKK